MKEAWSCFFFKQICALFIWDIACSEIKVGMMTNAQGQGQEGNMASLIKFLEN